jgi:hypothetical protein
MIDGKHYITIFLVADYVGGEPQVLDLWYIEKTIPFQ